MTLWPFEVTNRMFPLATTLQPSNNHDEDEAVFKAKTSALQKFLHHGMSRFSVDGLSHILDDLKECVGDEGDTNVRSVQCLLEYA